MRFNCIVEHVKYCIVNLYTPITKKEKKLVMSSFPIPQELKNFPLAGTDPHTGPWGPVPS